MSDIEKIKRKAQKAQEKLLKAIFKFLKIIQINFLERKK